MEVNFNPNRKNIDHDETMFQGPIVKPCDKSHVDQHVEPNVEAFVATSGCPQANPLLYQFVNHLNPLMNLMLKKTLVSILSLLMVILLICMSLIIFLMMFSMITTSSHKILLMISSMRTINMQRLKFKVRMVKTIKPLILKLLTQI